MREHHGLIAAWVGERLRLLRAAQTQAEFAAGLGMDQAQYNRYETGKRLAPDWVIEAAAQGQGLSPVQALWGREEHGGPGRDQDPALARAVAELLDLLDDEALEDLFYFLKNKTENLARRRRKEVREAQAALEFLRRRVERVP